MCQNFALVWIAVINWNSSLTKGMPNWFKRYSLVGLSRHLSGLFASKLFRMYSSKSMFFSSHTSVLIGRTLYPCSTIPGTRSRCQNINFVHDLKTKATETHDIKILTRSTPTRGTNHTHSRRKTLPSINLFWLLFSCFFRLVIILCICGLVCTFWFRQCTDLRFHHWYLPTETPRCQSNTGSRNVSCHDRTGPRWRINSIDCDPLVLIHIFDRNIASTSSICLCAVIQRNFHSSFHFSERSPSIGTFLCPSLPSFVLPIDPLFDHIVDSAHLYRGTFAGGGWKSTRLVSTKSSTPSLLCLLSPFLQSLVCI